MKGTRTLGVDIGSSCIKLAEVVSNGDQCVVENLARVPIGDGAVRMGQVNAVHTDAVAANIAETLRARGFKTRSAVIGLNNPNAVFTNIRSVDYQPPAVMAKVLKNLAISKGYITNAAEYMVDGYFLRERPAQSDDEQRQLDMLLVGVSETIMSTNFAMAEAAGLEVLRGDINPLAALRAVKFGWHDSPSMVDAIVDIGAGSTYTLLHANGAPVHLRYGSKLSGSGLTNVIERTGLAANFLAAEKLKVSGAEDNERARNTIIRAAEGDANTISQGINDALDEIKGCGFHNPLVGSITLLGGATRLIGLREALQSTTGVPVNYAELDDARLGGRNELLTKKGNCMVTAIGLGINKAGGVL